MVVTQELAITTKMREELRIMDRFQSVELA
jgi:hypothetical protein